jgi:glycosyltransferase involved in cell wall biosynthesis
MSEQSDARVPLSVLVPVKNEAANLRDCFASVSFAEEIVVVDSASTDGTQAIAEAAGARVVQFVGDNILSGDNEVHEHVLLNGRAEYLSAPMEHYAFPDIATFVEKHNRYST